MEKLIDLAFIRNALFSNKFNDYERELLDVLKNKIIESNSRFKDLAINAINNCQNDIQIFNYESAGREIDLIHNFTFNNYDLWDQNYFYSIELLSYIELTKDLNRVKALISLLAKLPN